MDKACANCRWYDDGSRPYPIGPAPFTMCHNPQAKEFDREKGQCSIIIRHVGHAPNQKFLDKCDANGWFEPKPPEEPSLLGRLAMFFGY